MRSKVSGDCTQFEQGEVEIIHLSGAYPVLARGGPGVPKLWEEVSLNSIQKRGTPEEFTPQVASILFNVQGAEGDVRNVPKNQAPADVCVTPLVITTNSGGALMDFWYSLDIPGEGQPWLMPECHEALGKEISHEPRPSSTHSQVLRKLAFFFTDEAVMGYERVQERKAKVFANTAEREKLATTLKRKRQD